MQSSERKENTYFLKQESGDSMPGSGGSPGEEEVNKATECSAELYKLQWSAKQSKHA